MNPLEEILAKAMFGDRFTLEQAKTIAEFRIALSQLEAHINQLVIDELEKIPDLKWENHKHCPDPHYIQDRIKALKSKTGSKQ